MSKETITRRFVWMSLFGRRLCGDYAINRMAKGVTVRFFRRRGNSRSEPFIWPPEDDFFDKGGIGGWIARGKGASEAEVEALRWAAQELPDSDVWKGWFTPPTELPSKECQALLEKAAAELLRRRNLAPRLTQHESSRTLK